MRKYRTCRSEFAGITAPTEVKMPQLSNSLSSREFADLETSDHASSCAAGRSVEAAE